MVYHDDLLILSIYAMILKIIFVYCCVYWVCQAQLFKRAGYNPWLVLVPFYNSFIQHKIAFGEVNKWFWFLTFIFPSLYNMYQRYNYVRSFSTVGIAILALFFPLTISAILLLSGNAYTGPRQHILN